MGRRVVSSPPAGWVGRLHGFGLGTDHSHPLMGHGGSVLSPLHPVEGVPSQHLGDVEHTASPRQLRWAAGRGLGCSQPRGAVWGALGTGSREALLQEDVGARLSDPGMRG